MPTSLSTGECRTRSAPSNARSCSSTFWEQTSSMNCWRTVNDRPASSTVAAPRRAISSTDSANTPVTCDAAAGAPIVAIAHTSAMCDAAAITAAPPSEWPMSNCGAACWSRSHAAAATRSSTLELKLVFANSPSLAPRPVKSKRRTPKPASVSWVAIHVAARRSLLHVKQCANRANAVAAPLGDRAGPPTRRPGCRRTRRARCVQTCHAVSPTVLAAPDNGATMPACQDAGWCRSPTCSCTGRSGPATSVGRSCNPSSPARVSPMR